VLRRLLNSIGPGLADADFDAVAFSFAETDLPGEIGWCQGTVPITALVAVEAIASGALAVVSGSRDGTLRLFDPIATDTPQFALTVANLLDVQPVALPASLRPTPFRVRVGWQKNWSPIATPAASVTPAELQRLQSTGSAVTSLSSVVALRVAQQQELQIDGLYYAQADAQARADKWSTWLAGGPRAFTVQTGRYLDQMNLGTIGTISYPAYGLDTGFRGVVVGVREVLGARRLEITMVGSG
jgi:hypothetical protein